MAKKKQPKINGVKQEFDIMSFDKNFDTIKVNDPKGKIIDLLILDRQCEQWDLSKIKKGTRLIAIASKGKVRAYGKKAVTHILSVLPPLQLDLFEKNEI